MRTEKLLQHEEIAFNKVQERNNKTRCMHNDSNVYTKRLITIVPNVIVPRPYNKDTDLLPLRLVDFDVCLKDTLKKFIYVGLFSSFTKCLRVGFKWPKNKGKYDNG